MLEEFYSNFNERTATHSNLILLLPTSALDGSKWLLFEYLIIWFDYFFLLFDYGVKWGKFVVAVETWFLPSETIFVT